MQIDQLRIELRPRTDAQALDLGYALLRSHAGATYGAFLALWLPLVAVCMAVTALLPATDWACLFIAWWLRPALERAPLYVLSRQVFGTAVRWQEAVLAWPRQLSGGTLSLLTWRRPFAGRGLYQPVWQLEMARGAVATQRLRAICRGGTGASAFWFGIVCICLEVVLQLGGAGFIGIFFSDAGITNPLAALISPLGGKDGVPLKLLTLAIYGISVGIIAPIYTACCFTLYLNRRASLEAWDLELKLRQITPPQPVRSRGQAMQVLGVLAGALLLSFALTHAPSVQAAGAQGSCAAPEVPKEQQITRGPDQSPQQTRVRAQVDQLYASADLRGYDCVEVWVSKVAKEKVPDKKKEKEKKRDEKASKVPPLKLEGLASFLKVLVIAVAIALVAWLLYRYRGHFPSLRRERGAPVATEVGGLDIRAESLPPEVTATVRALWAEGQRRAALALLYRATLSRMVAEDGLALRQGDTEGDCLRHARQAGHERRLSEGRLAVAIDATAMWLDGAYGNHWPADSLVLARCTEWEAQFGAAARRGA